MPVITAEKVKNKQVLLRLDLDVPLGRSTADSLPPKAEVGSPRWSFGEAGSRKTESVVILDDFRLKAALPTLNLCLQNAREVIIMGHLGQPGGKEVAELSVGPIYDWLEKQGYSSHLESGKLKLLENLRFDPGEERADLEYARELASLGDLFVNEAFAAYHPAASTTVLPTLLPHAMGLRFAQEVRVLREVRENPKRPFLAIIGGAKVGDKYQAMVALSKIADAVLVGGLLAKEIKEKNWEIGHNVMVGKLNEEGTDLAPETVDAFLGMIKNTKQVVWSGPVGKYEDPQGNRGNEMLAQAIIDHGLDSIIGGGDTVAALKKFLDKFSFVSVGGGAILKFLSEGTLPTIQALE